MSSFESNNQTHQESQSHSSENSHFTGVPELNIPPVDKLLNGFSKIVDIAGSVCSVLGKHAKSASDELGDKFRSQLYKTNFEKVAEFNQLAGTSRLDKMDNRVFNSHPAMVATCMALINEEVKELNDAVTLKDLAETRDALADILYVVYGMAYRLGIDADRDFGLVHDSNMTKFCISEAEAKATVAKYKADFEAGTSPYDSPAYRLDASGEWWIVYNESTGKILKNINYKPVNLAL
jgi:predicted HAD superfamily Cof-like phosphohydrolase